MLYIDGNGNFWWASRYVGDKVGVTPCDEEGNKFGSELFWKEEMWLTPYSRSVKELSENV